MADNSTNLSKLEQSIEQLIQSISKEQATITNILGLQDETINRISTSSYKGYELVAINNSINRVTRNIVRLQILLQNKLSQLEKLLEILEIPEDETEV